MKQKHYMALDFGIGHGVAMLGTFDGASIALEPMHRFPVSRTRMLSTSYWDFPAMIINAKTGLSAFSARYGRRLDGIACDAWGVDFGLLDRTGNLLANPVHYLDERTQGAVEALHAIFPDRSLYQRTGIRARREGTLYQLFSMARSNSPLLDDAATMLLTADLVSYFLTGTPVQEYTLATTTGMYDAENRDWSRDIILGAKIPPGIAPEIVAPGTVIGNLLDDVAAECGLGPVPVIAPASHGMAGAVAASPARGEDWLCVSSGSRFQVTAELSGPVINDASFSHDFSNLGGVDGSVRLQKEVTGLGVLDAMVRVWSHEDDRVISIDEVLSLAEKAPSFRNIVNTADPRLEDAADPSAVLNGILGERGLSPLSDRGELARMFIESAVLAVRHAAQKLRELTGRAAATIHFVGRGVDRPFIAQALADAAGMTVKAGPVEARAVGNIIMQMMALGDIGSLAEARELVGTSFAIPEYEPRAAEQERWDEAYAKFGANL